jgi:hypothetical protein
MDLYGMEHAEYQALAQYNGEVARGVVHSVEWRTRMQDLQARFDAHMQRHGLT